MYYQRLLVFFVLSMAATALTGQTVLTGTVYDDRNEPVAFANVYLKDIYEGTVTDESGQFQFSTEVTGKQVVVVSSLNYELLEKPVLLSGEPVELAFVLSDAEVELRTVVITAGAFEASDEKKATILKPLDIVTNAGAAGDIFGALQTLPGVAQVGDETGIFVRGGDAYETKTIIDGTIVQQPFFSEVPNIPSRGRFDPFAFKGTLFTTGGYSAEYGRALSSVLILDTQDLPDNSSSSFGVNMAGVSVAHTELWNDRTALIGSVDYTNLSPLFGIVPQNRDWVTPPQGFGSSWAFRHQTDKGLFKSYAQWQDTKIGLSLPNLDQPGGRRPFENRGRNWYWNNSYRGILGQDWSVFAALTTSLDQNDGQIDSQQFGDKTSFHQAKVTLGRELGRHLFLKMGTEVHWTDFNQSFEQTSQGLNELYTAAFSEAEMQLSSRLALRLGVRSEYSDLTAAWNAAPRVSLAVKTAPNSQVSMAYGQFFQRPELEFFQPGIGLDFERSTHYLINYQWQTEERTLRVEAYYKAYDQLIKWGESEPSANTGNGRSAGVDLFWRDQKTVRNLDYWVSYSYIDAQRNYRDFPMAATPTFVTDHTLSIVANYRLANRRVRIGGAYTFAAGRTYFNPNNPEFLGDRTIDYHNFNANVSYLTALFGHFTVAYFSLRNPLAIRQVFGYDYSSDGSRRSAILPTSDRSFFIGVFVSIE